MTRPRSGRRILIAVGMLTALTGCGGDVPASDGPDRPVPQVIDDRPSASVGWEQEGGPVVLLRSAFLGDAAFAIALEEGWFEEAGIAVETVASSSPADVFASIVAGDIDVAYFAPNAALFSAVTDGAPVRIVAAASVLDPAECDYLSVLGTPEAARRVASGDVGQMDGLRLGVSLRSLTAVRFLDAVLADWGVSALDGPIEVVLSSNTDLVALMATGQIDLAVAYEPQATLLERTAGAVPILGATDVLPDELTSLYLFSERLLADRELGARVLAVYLRGVEAYRAGPTERNVRIVAAQTGIEPGLLAEMCWATLDSDGRRYEGVVQDAQRTAIARGELAELVPAEQLWDHGFRDRAIELLGRTP